MKLYRTESALLDNSFQCQLLEHMLWNWLDGENHNDLWSLLIQSEEVIGFQKTNEALEALIELEDLNVVRLSKDDSFMLHNPVLAMQMAGFYPAEYTHLAPEGETLICLSHKAEAAIEVDGVEKFAADVAASFAKE